MARTVEDDDDQILDVAIEPLGDGFEIVRDRSIQIDGPLAGRTNNNFFHVQIGSMQQPPLFTGREDGDGAGGPRGTEIGALEWIDGNVNFWKQRFRCVGGEANLFSDV